jgi:hypothetical protein
VDAVLEEDVGALEDVLPGVRSERDVMEPVGNRIELANAAARLLLDPDSPVVEWSQEERKKGQAWGMKTIETFHTHGTPNVAIDETEESVSTAQKGAKS